MSETLPGLTGLSIAGCCEIEKPCSYRTKHASFRLPGRA
jgi:predicted metal-binding transcription factor (methanogenesis marker protein 9)